MPRKDPVSGCQVATFGEFIVDEATKQEGIEPHELMNEMFDSMAEAVKREEDRYQADALSILQKAVLEQQAFWQEEQEHYAKFGETVDWSPAPCPVKLVSVEHVEYRLAIRGQSGGIVAMVECEDKKSYRFEWTWCQDNGSFYCESSYDSDLKFTEVMQSNAG